MTSQSYIHLISASKNDKPLMLYVDEANYGLIEAAIRNNDRFVEFQESKPEYATSSKWLIPVTSIAAINHLKFKQKSDERDPDDF